MKVNFWQAVGAVLIIVGVIFYLRSRISPTDTLPPTNMPAATQPEN